MGSAMPVWVQMVLAVASWGLVIGGWVLIVVWARGKRGPGARWCAKCLYDMTGLPGMRCPECGREAKHEKQLRRRKRSWWALAVALLLFRLNYAMWVPIRLRHEGWRQALVPTGALVLGLPWVAQDRSGPASEIPGVPRPVRVMPVWDAGYDLVLERIGRDELSAWHWEAVGQIGLRSNLQVLLRDPWQLHRSVAGLLYSGVGRGEFRESIAQRIRDLAWIDVKTREVWPQGSTVIARIRVQRWQPYQDTSVRVRVVDGRGREVGAPARTTEDGDFGLTGRRVGWSEDTVVRIVPDPSPERKSQRYTVQLIRTDKAGNAAAPFATKHFEVAIAPEGVEEFLTAVPFPAGEVFEEVSNVQSTTTNDGFHLLLTLRRDRLKEMNMTVGVSVEVFRGNDKRFTGTGLFHDGRDERWAAGGRERVRINLEPVGMRKTAADGLWRIVISSHPELVLQEFDCDRYWAGQGEWLLPVESGSAEN